MKSLHNTDTNGTTKNVKDVKFFGGVDMWQLLCKASSESEGWMKSTKAMQLPHGVLVQTTTQQRNPDGSYALTDAIAFVPCVQIMERRDGDSVIARYLASGSY